MNNFYRKNRVYKFCNLFSNENGMKKLFFHGSKYLIEILQVNTVIVITKANNNDFLG